jgi:hypothetical protein
MSEHSEKQHSICSQTSPGLDLAALPRIPGSGVPRGVKQGWSARWVKCRGSVGCDFEDLCCSSHATTRRGHGPAPSYPSPLLLRGCRGRPLSRLRETWSHPCSRRSKLSVPATPSVSKAAQQAVNNLRVVLSVIHGFRIRNSPLSVAGTEWSESEYLPESDISTSVKWGRSPRLSFHSLRCPRVDTPGNATCLPIQSALSISIRFSCVSSFLSPDLPLPICQL